MAKAYDLNLYKYLKFLLEHCPCENMSDEELDRLAPWSIEVQEQCGIKQSKMLAFQNPIQQWDSGNLFWNTQKLGAYVEKALVREKPGKGLILHSDQGSQYTSWELGLDEAVRGYVWYNHVRPYSYNG